ncbi:MAG: hypothetical protein SWK90_17550 [Chloroflexota bacterium]|nr:hypothetical protein [Chloroflexota bacterium]
MKKNWMILGALIVILPFAGVALASGTPSIDWWVIGSGGESTTVGSTSLNSTIGQWMVGSDTVGDIQLGSGFWGGGGPAGAVGEYRIFLPLVLREK